MARVWDETDVDGTDLIVLLCLADHANDDGDCWPSIPRLAKRARRSDRQVRRVLADLEERGLVVRDPRPGRSSIYHVLPLSPLTGVSSATPVTDDTPTPVTDDTPPLTPVTPRTVKESPVESAVEVVTAKSVGDTPEVSPGNQPDFPLFARAALDPITPERAAQWQTAWLTAHAISREADPMLSLTAYLAYRRQHQQSPSPEDFTQWFTRDEQTARQAAAIPDPKEEPRQWWEEGMAL
jgi:Helix-turn-helix domain